MLENAFHLAGNIAAENLMNGFTVTILIMDCMLPSTTYFSQELYEGNLCVKAVKSLQNSSSFPSSPHRPLLPGFLPTGPLLASYYFF